MEEEKAGQQSQESGQTQEQEQSVDVNELAAKLEKLENYNNKLLKETREWRGKYQGLRSDVEEQNTAKMQEANDFKGLYEKTLEEVTALKEGIKNEKKSALETTLKYEVAKNAKDAEDTDLLLAAIKLKKKDLLGYDSDAGTWKGVEDAISDLRVSNPGLFIQEKPGMVNGRPQAAVPKDKSLDELIAEDSDGVLKDALGKLLGG